MGRVAVHTRQLYGWLGNSWSGLPRRGQEITANVYGVVVMMSQGHSRVPNSLIECK